LRPTSTTTCIRASDDELEEVYADTAYFIALLSRSDDLHSTAVALAQRLRDEGSKVVVTSEAVLLELLGGMSSRGALARAKAAETVSSLLDDPMAIVVPQTRDLVRAATRLYADRTDKEWSGVDGLSMVVMDTRGIREVLTHDHHFEQAGKRILL